MVDDDIINQMEMDSDGEQHEEEGGSDSGSEEEEGKIEEDDPDLKDLEQQFVKGGQSD